MDFSIFAWWGLKWEECCGGGEAGAEVRSPPQGLSHHCWAPTAGGNAHQGLTPCELTPCELTPVRGEGDVSEQIQLSLLALKMPREQVCLARMQVPPHS